MYDYIVTVVMNKSQFPLVKVFDSDYDACLFEANVTTDLIKLGFIYKQTIRFDDAYDTMKIIYKNPKSNQDVELLIKHTRKFNLQKLFKRIKQWIKKE